MSSDESISGVSERTAASASAASQAEPVELTKNTDDNQAAHLLCTESSLQEAGPPSTSSPVAESPLPPWPVEHWCVRFALKLKL